MNQLKGAALAAALSLAYAGSAAAEIDTGFYAGVGVGQSTIENDEDFIDFDEDDTGFKVFGGYQFNKFIAVELAYINGGEPSDEFSTDVDVDLGGGNIVTIPGVDVKNELEIAQINASAVGTYAFNDYFGVMGRLGLSYVDAEFRQTATGFDALEADDDTTELAYGLGLWVAPTENFLLRLEYEMTSAELFDDVVDEDTDITLISVSAAYKFAL